MAVKHHRHEVFPHSYVPVCTDPVELTMRRWPLPLWRVSLESNGAVNCQAITQLFPSCGAGRRVIPVPWPVTSGEWVKCSGCSRQCQPASHVQPEWPSPPASLPEDWPSSMHQWHQPSQGRCSTPNQWFIRTQLAGRPGAFCHMPWGSPAICTHSLPLYSQLSLASCSLSVCVASVCYSTSTGLQSVPFSWAVFFVRLKRVSSRDSACLSPATQVSELGMSPYDLQLKSCCASWLCMKYSSIYWSTRLWRPTYYKS